MTAPGSRRWLGLLGAVSLLGGCTTPAPEVPCDEICPGYVGVPLQHSFWADPYEVLDDQVLSRVRAGNHECQFELLSLTATAGEIVDPPEQRYFPWDAGTSSPVGEDLVLVVEWTCKNLAFGTTQVLFTGAQLQSGVEVEGAKTELE